MNSALTCLELANGIMAKASEKLPSELAEKALIAVGVTPYTKEARAWLGLRAAPDEICIIAYSYNGDYRENVSPIEHEKALGKMILAQAEYYRTYHLATFEGTILHSEISNEGLGDDDCAVRYAIKEHDVNPECGFGAAPVLDLYVYVNVGNQHDSRMAAWSVEPLILQWADDSGKMWSASHKPLF